MIEIKNGTLNDFFKSAKETAKEIDAGKKLTPKNTIWMETSDLLNILKPSRTKLIEYLKDKTKVSYSKILEELKKSPSSLNRDLELLEKYQLADVFKERNSGHVVKKVVKPLFLNEKLEFRVVIE